MIIDNCNCPWKNEVREQGQDRRWEYHYLTVQFELQEPDIGKSCFLCIPNVQKTTEDKRRIYICWRHTIGLYWTAPYSSGRSKLSNQPIFKKHSIRCIWKTDRHLVRNMGIFAGGSSKRYSKSTWSFADFGIWKECQGISTPGRFCRWWCLLLVIC